MMRYNSNTYYGYLGGVYDSTKTLANNSSRTNIHYVGLNIQVFKCQTAAVSLHIQHVPEAPDPFQTSWIDTHSCSCSRLGASGKLKVYP